jgi:hypothetical protein
MLFVTYFFLLSFLLSVITSFLSFFLYTRRHLTFFSAILLHSILFSPIPLHTFHPFPLFIYLWDLKQRQSTFCLVVFDRRNTIVLFLFNVSWSVRASSYIPISRPTDATCDRILFSIYMCITLHDSSVKRSSSGVPHRTYSLQFLCLCLSAALSFKKLLSYKTVPQTDTNTETGGCMYSEGLFMMSAWRSKHVELHTYR